MPAILLLLALAPVVILGIGIRVLYLIMSRRVRPVPSASIVDGRLVEPPKPPIFALVEKDDVEGVRALLAREPSLVNKPDPEYQRRPLHKARSVEMTRLLLDAGAQVDAPGWMKASALFEAVGRDNADQARLLLERGANVNFQREAGYTPLHFVTSAAIADVLLAAGANQRARDGNGNTPAMRAAYDRRVEMLVYLLSKGGVVDDTPGIGGSTALHEAAWCLEGNVEIVRVLLDAGLDPNAEDEHGKRPLMCAVNRPPRGGVLELLLERGAHPELTNHDGYNALDAARRENDTKAAALFEANLRHRGILGKLPEKPRLRLAIAVGEDEVVGILPEGFLARFRATPTGELELIAHQPIQSTIRDLCLAGDAIYAIGQPGPVWVAPANLSSPPKLMPLPLDGLESFDVHAAAVSPNGLFIAVAFDSESVRLWNVSTGEFVDLPGGERTSSVAFSPDSRLLAIARSFQGGGDVQIYSSDIAELKRAGENLEPRHEFDRAHTETSADDFVDTLSHVQFTSDGQQVLLFETSAIYRERKPRGWRGNLVLLDLGANAAVALTSVDASATGDPRSIDMVHHGMGFHTDPSIISGGRIACGATNGVVALYDAKTLKLLGKQHLCGGGKSSAHSVYELGGRLWALTGELLLQPTE